MKQKLSDEEFKVIVKESLSIAEVIRKCGRIPAGGNYAITHERIKRLGLNTSHFTGQGWNKGDRHIAFVKAKPLQDILVKDSYYQTFKLAKRLLKEGLKERRCECCGNTEWLERPIPLELHHINGNKRDNRIENLVLLCPNCHAQTDNYRGKNKIGRMVEC